MGNGLQPTLNNIKNQLYISLLDAKGESPKAFIPALIYNYLPNLQNYYLSIAFFS